MITIDDKLDIFYKLVYKDEEEKCKRFLEEQEERNKKILEAKTSSLMEAKENLLERKRNLAEIQKNEMISKAIEKNRERILSKREELLEDLMQTLEEKAKEFTKTKDYENYVLSKIQDLINEVEEHSIIIGLTEIDLERFKNSIIKIGEESNKEISFSAITKDLIGGFILSDKNKTYNLDNSFKTIIFSNRYEIGKKLHGLLEKTGDLNE
ncbi:V-type ATP synthase subunit E [Tissierella sp. MB52-C2]|uniref:V-type ATP synthase subunit E n=1 Tax=Tissierella sp. MB52-C2 TaxID=3070999 RepID=UPI00280B7C70|nr:V-type ATP synthase subunit E [Tissierella sp. MB52-C2]WMM24603.1 V-type ATP synthase subunit E [Tissierella sp. MB52-C2]